MDFPPYPSGLILAGRRVVVVGGGHVAQRRIPALLAAGADVLVVSPEVTPAIEGMVGAGEVAWRRGGFEATDLEGAWYVIAAANDSAANQAVSDTAEALRIFCVRSDDAESATAWTPAVGREDGVTVAILGNRDPRRSVGVRDAVVGALRDGTLIARHERERIGGVTLVGGGPGDPDLITVAGRKALMDADVVIADRLAPRELLSELASDVELIDVAKLPRGNAASQDLINELIIDRAQAGKAVVRYKGGDNFVFGRGFEEILACRDAGIDVRVIPGLTSSISVPGLNGIPVTHRGVAHEFTVISGHLPPGHDNSLTNWAAVAQLHGTVVLLMAVQNAPAIAQALVDGGRSPRTPVAIICDGSMATERTVLATLETVAERIETEAVKPPAIIVIGPVVAVGNAEAFDD